MKRWAAFLFAVFCLGAWWPVWAAEETGIRLDGVGASGRIDTLLGPLPYVVRLEMEASGYYPGPESTGPWADGITSAGLPAGYGVVAVDPLLIPLGTVLYIPGYGVAIAGDVGSAIKGLKIDLGFDSYREALFFGRRTVDVYVLEPGWLAAAGDGAYPEPWLALALQAVGESGSR